MDAPDRRCPLHLDDQTWDTKDVGRHWKKSPKFVSTAAKDGRIPGALKVGNEWRFKPSKIRDMEGTLPPATNPRPRRPRDPKPLKNPARPRRRGHPKPVAKAPVHGGPRTASEWADYWAAQGAK